MNKFISKIIGATLAFAMMIGGAVGINAAKEAKEVNAEGADTTKYQLINSVDDLEAGKSYILTNGTSGTVKAIAVTSNNNNRKTTNATIDSAGKISRGSSILSFTLGGTSGAWTFLTENYASTNGYFASAASGKNNQLRVISKTSDEKHNATISFSGNAAVINIEPHNSRTLVRYNSSNDCFACYEKDQNAVYLFKEVAASTYVTSVSASIKDGVYYAGDKLSATDFNITASWSAGDDTHPDSDFTWTVNGVLDGNLKVGSNEIIVTYGGVNSNPFNVTGSSRPATSINIEKDTIVLNSIGETETLAATVLPENTSDIIAWSSDDESVATIDQNGKVTAVAAGTATITATAGSVSDTCEVTVINNQKATIDFTDKNAYSVAKPSSAQSEAVQATVGGYNLNLLNAYNSNGSNEYLMIGTKEFKTSNSLVSNKTAVPGAITKIVFTTTNSASTSAIYNATLSNTEVTETVTDDTHTLTGKGSITITADEASNYHFFAISSVNSSANGQIKDITIYYVPSAIKADIENLNTQTTLSYHYNKDTNNVYTYSNIVMRFGGVVDKTDWSELDDIYNVTGFGVILTDGDMVKTEDDLNDAMLDMVLSTVSTDLNEHLAIDYFVPVANMNETIGSDSNNYFWNLCVSINSAEMNKLYTAVAYIKLGDDYVLMNFARESVETLALDYLTNRNCDATTAGGSLKAIVDNAQ